MTTHVEFLPNVVTFCGLHGEDFPRGDAIVLARDWMPAVERLQVADCTGCLMKLVMLGDSAKLKLTRMGYAVQVHDVEDVPVESVASAGTAARDN